MFYTRGKNIFLFHRSTTYVYRGSVQALAAMEQYQNQGPAIATTQSDVPDIDLTGLNKAS